MGSPFLNHMQADPARYKLWTGGGQTDIPQIAVLGSSGGDINPTQRSHYTMRQTAACSHSDKCSPLWSTVVLRSEAFDYTIPGRHVPQRIR